VLHKDDQTRDPSYGPRLDPAKDDMRKFRVPDPPGESNEEIYYGPSRSATRFN